MEEPLLYKPSNKVEMDVFRIWRPGVRFLKELVVSWGTDGHFELREVDRKLVFLGGNASCGQTLISHSDKSYRFKNVVILSLIFPLKILPHNGQTAIGLSILNKLKSVLFARSTLLSLLSHSFLFFSSPLPIFFFAPNQESSFSFLSFISAN